MNLTVVALVSVAIVAYTVLSFLLKMGAENGRPDRVITTAVAVVTVLAAIFALATEGRNVFKPVWNSDDSSAVILGILLSLGAGILFYIASVYRVKALQTAPASTVFAITNLDLVTSGFLIVILSLFVPALNHGASFSPAQLGVRLVAILIAGGAILIGQQLQGKESLPRETFLSLLILSLSALGYVFYATFLTPILFFIVLDHLAGVILNARSLVDVKQVELKWGAAIGLCMFIGFWALLQAISLSQGNPAVLLALNLKTPLTAILAVPLFKETMTRDKIAAVVLATAAIFLWELSNSL